MSSEQKQTSCNKKKIQKNPKKSKYFDKIILTATLNFLHFSHIFSDFYLP